MQQAAGQGQLVDGCIADHHIQQEQKQEDLKMDHCVQQEQEQEQKEEQEQQELKMDHFQEQDVGHAEVILN